MNKASVGKFYFETLEEITEGILEGIMDLEETEFATCITDEKLVALRKLYSDLNNLACVKDFLNS